MILKKVLHDLFRHEGASADAPKASVAHAVPIVLNVGGNSKDIPIPGHYAGWTHLLLDIDPAGNPDIVCDARDLQSLDAGQFDAVYCSHNLEHYYRHDAAQVLRGFLHVLKPDGFAEIRVPDLMCIMRHVVTTGMDIEDTLYVSGAGPITVRDVIYGFGKQIEESGVDFYAHKTGFTPTTLSAFLAQAGFGQVFVQALQEDFEVRAVAFRAQATPAQRVALAL